MRPAEMGFVTTFWPSMMTGKPLVTQFGDTMSVVERSVKMVSLVGQARTTFAPARVMVSAGGFTTGVILTSSRPKKLRSLSYANWSVPTVVAAVTVNWRLVQPMAGTFSWSKRVAPFHFTENSVLVAPSGLLK